MEAVHWPGGGHANRREPRAFDLAVCHRHGMWEPTEDWSDASMIWAMSMKWQVNGEMALVYRGESEIE